MIAILNTLSCHHPDEPKIQNDPTPGKRDYTWTVDTVVYPNSIQTMMRSIWASSPKDVYIVGRNACGDGNMFHYDGSRWRYITLAAPYGGPINAEFDLNRVYGFDSNDVWAVGSISFLTYGEHPVWIYSSIIIHYDGVQWKEFPIQRGGGLIGIWGLNKNDIWAGGDKGALYHYNGDRWSKLPLDTNIFMSDFGGYSSNDIYATSGRDISAPGTFGSYILYLRHWDGAAWSVVDSFYSVERPWKFGTRLYTTSGALYSSGYNVVKLSRGNDIIWNVLLPTDTYVTVDGSSPENIYAVGDDYFVQHWNGQDWKPIPVPLSGFGFFTCSWTDNTETFIVGTDGFRTYVMHGK